MRPSLWWILCVVCSIVTDSWTGATPASPAYARLGSTAFLSWKLPRPGLREFTVRRLSSKSLFHITDYNQVNVTDRYKSRAAFTGRMNSSGSGVFSFQLHNVDWPDSAEYRCHRGSPGSTGSRVYDCGQRLVVIYIADPYIVAPQTVEADKNVTLTCYVAVKGDLKTSIAWSWRRNEVEQVNIGRLPLAVSKLHGDYFYHKSALTVSDVGQDDDRGRYTCKAELVGWNVQTDWSEDFGMSTKSRMEEVPNYTQVREGDHAMVAWRMPRYRYEFYIMTPSGDKLMAVDSNKVYIRPKYWLRTRMVEVVTSRNTSTYVFRLYNVTLADAGRYACRREKSATKISMTRCIHDLFVSRHDVRDSNAVMTSPVMVPERSFPDVTVVVGCSIVSITLILLGILFLSRLEHIREYWSLRFRQSYLTPTHQSYLTPTHQSYLTPTQTTHGPHEQEGGDEYAVIEDADGSGSVFYHMQSPRASSSDYEEVRPFPPLDAQTSAEPGTVDDTDAEHSN